MLGRQILSAAILVSLISQLFLVFAQEPRPHTQSAISIKSNGNASSATLPTGIITDRLSPKDLARWKEIEKLVFAEDEGRQPLHPTLRWMWEWIETSGHSVYIQIIRDRRTSTCNAGNFTVEKLDPRWERHTAVIKLNLRNIDLAYAGPNTARKGGFIPFDGLDKEERYAEVLGHEMSHAIYILNSTETSQKVLDYVERTNELLLSQTVRRKPGPLGTELKNRLSKRDALLKELEAQAEEMEHIVWKELIAGKKAER